MSSSAETTAPAASGAAQARARKADPTEADAVAGCLAAAFFDDPVFRWLHVDELRAEAIGRFFDEVVDALAPHDDIWTVDDARTGQVQLLGAAVWIPYGRQEMPPARAEQFRARMSELPGVHHDRAARLGRLVDAAHPSEPHEYLRFLGVATAAQGRGIGTALMAPVLRRADDAGHPAYLVATSARSRGLYERHGFAAREPLSPGDGLQLWPMWREPR